MPWTSLIFPWTFFFDVPVTAGTEVSTDVTDVQLFLYFSRDSEPHEVVPMKSLDAGEYFASIPSQRRGTLIEYYVEARAPSGATLRDPSGDAYQLALSRPQISWHFLLVSLLLTLTLSGVVYIGLSRTR